jgi:hypothetical protein
VGVVVLQEVRAQVDRQEHLVLVVHQVLVEVPDLQVLMEIVFHIII